MTDQEPKPHIIVPLAMRYAVWPGGEWLAVEASLPTHGGVYRAIWLTDQETGRSHELRAYSYRAWQRQRGCR